MNFANIFSSASSILSAAAEALCLQESNARRFINAGEETAFRRTKDSLPMVLLFASMTENRSDDGERTIWLPLRRFVHLFLLEARKRS